MDPVIIYLSSASAKVRLRARQDLEESGISGVRDVLSVTFYGFSSIKYYPYGSYHSYSDSCHSYCLPHLL